MRVILSFAFAVLLSAASTQAADLTLTQTNAGRGHEGQQVQLWTSQFMRTNQLDGRVDFLVDFTQGVSYSINHEKRIIQKMNWDDLEAAGKALESKLKTLPPLVLKLMGADGSKVVVEDRGSETILDRECRKWRITMGPVLIETSNDPSVQPPVPSIPYQRFIRLQTLLGRFSSQATSALSLGEALSKVQGLALRYRIVLPVVGETTTLTTRIEEGPIPPSAFELPADYLVEDLGKKIREDLGGRLDLKGDQPASEPSSQPCSEI